MYTHVTRQPRKSDLPTPPPLSLDAARAVLDAPFTLGQIEDAIGVEIDRLRRCAADCPEAGDAAAELAAARTLLRTAKARLARRLDEAQRVADLEDPAPF